MADKSKADELRDRLKAELARAAQLRTELNASMRDAARSKHDAEAAYAAAASAKRELAVTAEHRDRLQTLCTKLQETSAASLAKLEAAYAAASAADKKAQEEESARVAGVIAGVQDRLSEFGALAKANDELRAAAEGLTKQLAAERTKAAAELRLKELETQLAEVRAPLRLAFAGAAQNAPPAARVATRGPSESR